MVIWAAMQVCPESGHADPLKGVQPKFRLRPVFGCGIRMIFGMTDSIYFDIGQGIRSQSDEWYKNVQHLGTGGNAVTQLVLCTSGANKGVLFALKVFRRLSASERRERFLGEVQFLRDCSHPSVMRVFDSGLFTNINGDYPFVVAEYLPLRRHHIRAEGKLRSAASVRPTVPR